MTYKATVQDGQVVVRNIELPNGTPVEVSVRAQTFDEAVVEAIREGEADFRRGDYGPVEDLLAAAGYRGVLHPNLRARPTKRRDDRRTVATKSRRSAKRVRR
jgi:hypothetical protein